MAPLGLQTSVRAVAFSPDGEMVLIGNHDRMAGLWDVAEQLPDDLPRIATWVEIVTSMVLDDQGVIHVLDNPALRKRRERLEQLGGTPELSKTGTQQQR
jgi:hypothetical protein